MKTLTVCGIVLWALCVFPPGETKVSLASNPSLVNSNSAILNSITGGQTATSQGDSKRTREGSITGRLLDGSGQPIPNAAIYVRRAGATGNVNRSLGTDSDGRFHADNLPPGAYSIWAYVPGYVNESSSTEPQYYRLGESVTIRMTKGGVISGTVTNSAGEPVVAARVSTIRVRDADGRLLRAAGLSGNYKETDDLGGYRLYGLQGGSYLVVVNGGSLSYFAPTPYDGDAPTYYPSTTRDAASEVTVHTGDEVSGIDIRYRREKGHVVSGTLSGSFGVEAASRGFSITLSNALTGAVEANAYIPLRGGERGFALYGVPDGEYSLQGQIDMNSETAAASPPRRLAVKGADITGVDLGLTPLISIRGRVVMEPLSESDRKPGCKDKSGGPFLDEIVISARRDDKQERQDQVISSLFGRREAAPEAKGEFVLFGLFAGKYRIETRVPSEDWFVRSITHAAAAQAKVASDAATAGLTLRSGQNVSDLKITVAEGAAGIRGKVVAGAGAALPSKVRIHLVPAEADAAGAVLRYYEAAADDEGNFSVGNIAPGHYFIVARAVQEEESIERTPQPLAWDAATRARLRGEAKVTNVVVDLQQCQRISDYLVKYSQPALSNKSASPKRP